jgi:hypothetical protein
MTTELHEALTQMFEELDSSCLEVMLVPQRYRTNEGGMIRVALSKNATWYRAFCAQNFRGPPTGVENKNQRIPLKTTDTLRTRMKNTFKTTPGMTTRELAGMIGQTPKWVARQCRRGGFPTLATTRRQLLIPRNALMRGSDLKPAGGL